MSDTKICLWNRLALDKFLESLIKSKKPKKLPTEGEKLTYKNVDWQNCLPIKWANKIEKQVAQKHPKL